MPYYMTTGMPAFSVNEDPYWNDEWGREYSIYQAFFKGEPFDGKYLPKSGYLDRPVKTYPPFVSLPYWLCNDEVKDLIESFEPGQHRFFPFELRKSKRGEVVAHYHILNIVGRIAAVDTDGSDPMAVENTVYDDGRSIWDISNLNIFAGGGDIALYEDRIGERHLWLEEIAPRYSCAFISDALYDALQPFIPKKKVVRFKKTI